MAFQPVSLQPSRRRVLVLATLAVTAWSFAATKGANATPAA